MENEELNHYIPDAGEGAIPNQSQNDQNPAVNTYYNQTQQMPEPSQHDYYTQPQQPYTQPTYEQTGYVPPINRYTPDPPKKVKKGGVGLGAVIAVAICCSIVGGIVGALVTTLFQPDPDTASTDKSNNASSDTDNGHTSNMLEGLRENVEIDITQIDTSKQLTPAEVYAKNVNSTVGITTSITTNYWGFQSTSAASGSGFIISDDGYILTNFHVIENSNAITVSLYDGTEYEAKLIGYDERNDIAVLKVDAENLVPVILGDSDTLNVGDPVVAIGNPLGELTFSLTSGTISAKDRTVTMSNGITMDLIQTDCAINSGNSGGALFNLYGEVVGITNAKYSSSSSGASIDNIGFAIPLNDVRKIVDSIIEKGYISKPYIGVSVTDVGEESLLYGLPKGASVRSVAEDSPAEECGLKEGDIITHVNGEEITGSNDLVSFIGDCEISDELTLTIFRRNNTLELKLIVGEQIQNSTGESTAPVIPGR